VEFLLVVHGQRKEVDAGLRALGGNDGREQARLAILRIDRGVGLARHAAGLERQLAPAPVNLDLVGVEHFRTYPSSTARAPQPPMGATPIRIIWKAGSSSYPASSSFRSATQFE